MAVEDKNDLGGGSSGTVRWPSWILPEVVSDSVISRMFGFNKLQGVEEEKVKHRDTLHGLSILDHLWISSSSSGSFMGRVTLIE